MRSTRRTWKSGSTRNVTGKRTTPHFGTTGTTGSTGSTWPATAYSPNKYNTYKKELKAKIQSYRTIHQQVTGSGKVTAFSPSGAHKWIRYVDGGAWVYKFNNTEFNRWFGWDWNGTTPTAVYRYLRKKFGSGIKAVTRGKGNNWLVAATPKVNGRPFSTYTWK